MLDRAKGRYDEGYNAIRDRRLTKMKMADIVKQEVRAYPGIPTVPRWGDIPEALQKRQSRKMELYAAMVADACIDGRASLPEVALGEDEFVELDAEGNVKKTSGRKKKSGKKPVRKADGE